MGALQRYILKSSAIAFLASLFAITGIVWVTQALREIELITAQGQSFWTFAAMTFLGVPLFIVIVAPFALFGAVMFVLNRLNADSELAAINAAGISPGLVLRPFLILAILVSLVLSVLSLSLIPKSLRLVREMITEIRADVIVNVLREGEFTNLDKVTIHVRRREAGAALLGLFIEDNRSEAENLVYTAERGQVLRTDEGSFLVLDKGAVQRKSAGDEDAAIVLFDRYAFDLSPFSAKDIEITYRPREFRFSELWKPRAGDPSRTPVRLMAEFNERILNAIYPFVFMAIAFAVMATPRSTRQGRFAAVVVAVGTAFAVRVAGLALVNLSKTNAWATPAIYVIMAVVLIGSFGYAFRGSFPLLRRVTTRRLAQA